MARRESEYAANYDSALSYLKLNLKEPAIEALKRALSQVAEEEQDADNFIYLNILASLAFLELEKRNIDTAQRYVEQGLATRQDHADLLFVKALVLLDYHQFDEMMEALIRYLIAVEAPDAGGFAYKYTHEVALNEVFSSLISTAYKYALQWREIQDITWRLFKTTGSRNLAVALERMEEIDRGREEN